MGPYVANLSVSDSLTNGLTAAESSSVSVPINARRAASSSFVGYGLDVNTTWPAASQIWMARIDRCVESARRTRAMALSRAAPSPADRQDPHVGIPGHARELGFLQRDIAAEQVGDATSDDFESRLRSLDRGGAHFIPRDDPEDDDAHRERSADGEREALPQ
jgi:hypothetical protein